MNTDPVTRQEMFLAKIGGEDVELPIPVTRKEQFYAKMAGQDIDVPTPVTREEQYLKAIIDNGGGASGTKQISIDQNGTTTENVASYASAEITVNVPNSYTAGDEGKVVDNGALVAQTAHAKVTSNGPIDTTLNNSVEVDVQGSSGIDVNAVCDRTIAGSITLTFEQYKNERTFMGCTGLTEIHLPNYTGGDGTNMVQNCTGLTVFDAPLLETLYGQMSGCSSIQTLVFKSVTKTGANGVLRPLASLKTVDFACTGGSGNLFSNGYCFENDSNFDTLIIRRIGSVAGLGAINNFNGTKFASGGAGGTIYIPKALYDHLGDGTSLDYKAASNWSTIDAYGTITWAKIEGSIYENAYADGTPIT